MTAQALDGISGGRSLAELAGLSLPVWITGDAAADRVRPPAALAFLAPHALIAGAAAGSSAAALTGIGVAPEIAGDAAGTSLAELSGLRMAAALTADAAGAAGATLALLSGVGGASAAIELRLTAFGGSDAATDVTISWLGAGEAAGAGQAACSFAYPLPVVRGPLAGEYPGTVNLILNPSLEYASSGISGWSGTSIARDTAVGWSGTASARVSRTGAGSVSATVTSVAGLGLAGGAYAGQVMAASDVAGTATVTVAAIDAAGETVGTASEPVTLDGLGTWARLVGWTAAGAADVERVELRVTASLTGTGQVWLDGAQIEQDRGYGETQYADGDAGTGCRWNGEPGASVSVREPR